MGIDCLNLSRSKPFERFLDKLYRWIPQVVAELVGDHPDPGGHPECVEKAIMPADGGRRAYSAFDFDDVSSTIQFLDDEFARLHTNRPVFSADPAGNCGVHLPVKRDDGNVRLHHLLHNWGKRLSLYRADDQDFNALLYQAFHITYLLASLVLAVGDDELHVRIMFSCILLISF